MIEEPLGIGSRLRFTAQANPLGNGTVDQISFGRCFEDKIESFVGDLLINLFQPEIALQSLPANGPLLHAQRGKAVRELGVIEIAVFTQTLDHCFNCGFGCAPAFEQTLS